MFFKLAAWNANKPSGPVNLSDIENLFKLHPQIILNSLEYYYRKVSLINPSLGAPDYAFPSTLTIETTPNIKSQIDALSFPNERWDHSIYSYLVENTRCLEIFDRIVRIYDTGEGFETPDPDTALWLRTTESLFYSELPSTFIGSLTSDIRPDMRAIRRNTYYRLFGLDLNHGTNENRPYPFEKPPASNKEFVAAFEDLLRQVWLGGINAKNLTGRNETDDAAIADRVRVLKEMFEVRRINGNLRREEFWSVVTMSWFHLSAEADTPIVRALKSSASSFYGRIKKLGERAGVPAHRHSDAYINMAFPLSAVLTFIETEPTATDPANAAAFYNLTGPQPHIAAYMRTITTYWSIATGRDLKGIPVVTSSR